MTFDEDNRYFSTPGCRTEFIDRLKFFPFDGTMTTLTFHLAQRLGTAESISAIRTGATVRPGMRI
jgi:hypothetical protein